jgi:hypothetical protein
MEIRIAKHGWTQVSGDMNPGKYGGTIAKADGDHIEMLQIQPVREHIGDRDAAEVGHPFWTKEGYFDLDDLQLDRKDVQRARRYTGLNDDILQGLKPESRAMAIAEALLEYRSDGRGDGGSGGWAKDVIPSGVRVKWRGSKQPQGWRFLEDEDVEFRRLLLRESRK